MRKRLLIAALAVIMAFGGVLGLVACSGEEGGNNDDKLASPANFTFDTQTGAYAFDAVENGQFYYIVIAKIDNKGNEYADIVGMTSMIPGTGRITGNVELRAFSDATIAPGGIISVQDLPKASYVAKCIATASGYKDSDASTVDFTIGGTLEFPKTTYNVKDGKLTVSLACFYFEQALWFKGVPSRIEVYVKNRSTGANITTLTYDDFSFTNSFLAYKTFYIMTNPDKEFTLPDGVGESDLEITAKAFGDGNTIKDSIEVPSMQKDEPFVRVIDFWAFGWPEAGWDSFWDEYAN